MKNTLIELASSNELCAIYSDSINTNKFTVGYILNIIDDSFLVACIDPNGKPDGIQCITTDAVLRVETKSKYCKTIHKLIACNMQTKLPIVEYKENAKISLIEYAKCNKRICEFELCGSDSIDVIGFIVEYNNDSIAIQQIDTDGRIDGESRVSIISVTRIVCDSNETVKLEILHNKLSDKASRNGMQKI